MGDIRDTTISVTALALKSQSAPGSESGGPTPPTDNASPGFPHLAIGDMLLPDLRRGTKHAMLQYADTRLCCYYCSTAAASFGTFLQTGVLHVQHDDTSALVFMTQEERMGRGLEWLYLWSAS